MAEFSTVFLCSKRAVKLGYRPPSAFFRANLDCKRQIWPAAWCGLHYVRPRIAMQLERAINQSGQWMVCSSNLADGLDISSAAQCRVAAALFHLCTEHQQAVHTLTNHGLIGSAFALLRPQFEAYVRGVWYHRCANDDQLNAFIKGAEPPRIGQLLSDIAKITDFNSDSLIATKTGVWGVLNDFTHGGSVQVRARVTSNEINRNYKTEHIVGMLRWSSILSFLGYVGMASIAENDLLANKLRESFHSIYAGDISSIRQAQT